MKLNSYNKKIASIIIIFPPLILIIYAIVSYTIFFNSQTRIYDNYINTYKHDILSNNKKELKSRLKSVNGVIDSNKLNIHEAVNLFDSIHSLDSYFIVFDNTYEHSVLNNADKSIKEKYIQKLKNINHFYEDRDIVAYSLINKRLNLKIVSFFIKSEALANINSIKKSLYEEQNRTFSKSLYWLIFIWFVLLLISLVVSIKVYNRLKEYEKTLQESNRDIIFKSRQAMLGELLPMIAHQWRQPLNKIASVLIRMRFEIMSGHPNPQTLDRQSQIIEDSVELMSQTVDDFRTFYRPTEDIKEVELSTLIRKAGYFLDELVKRKKIQLRYNLSSVTMKVHSNEFLQVLMNLVKNAADAVEEGGEIDISLKELENGRVEVRVEDNGTGIPKEKLKKIFEAHESSKQASMGLGLYMSKLIIEDKFGGKIEAYNTDRGAGFLIVLYKK